MIPEMKTSIEIRPITSRTEMRAVENLQKEVWGMPDLDVVPLTHLAAAVEAGGVLLGAFDGEILAGFAYGFASYENGRAGHHSHMLGVRPEYRNLNLGEKLKKAQREHVLNRGLSEMTWTFDPLQSLNAYFNFSKLGVVSDRYIVDFYGADAASFLHRNSTDRLWVTWHLDSERVRERIEKKAEAVDTEDVKMLVRLGETDVPQVFDLPESDGQMVIEIPPDINELQKRDAGLAIEWREATRRAFTKALAKGCTVREFYRGKRGEQTFGAYLLKR